MFDIELTTMCAIVKNNMVLMINRKRNWSGWSFPGGHLENAESIKNCVVREIYEETGLNVSSLQYKGIAHFFNTKNNKRHIISNFICTDFYGQLEKNCGEGELKWVKIDDIKKLTLAEGMEYRLPLFFDDGLIELYVEWDENNGYTKISYHKI